MSNTYEPIGLIRGLSYNMPTSGTIRHGYTVERERSGKVIKLPVGDDEFKLTTKIKENGFWQRHPLDAVLRGPGEDGIADPEQSQKLRAIPVSIMFDRPDLTMAEQYAAFSDQGRPLCVGNGERAKQRSAAGEVRDVACPGPEDCVFGRENRCDAFMRLLVRVEGQADTDPPFILRTGSVNAVVDNRATLEHWHAMFDGKLAGLPFRLTLQAKQSAMSFQRVFHYARLEPAFATVAAGAACLKARLEADQLAGIDRAASELRLVALKKNGAFAESTPDDAGQFDDLWLVGEGSGQGVSEGSGRAVGNGAQVDPSVMALSALLAEAQVSHQPAPVGPQVRAE